MYGFSSVWELMNLSLCLQALEKAQDWLTAFSGEAASVIDDSAVEKEGAKEKLELISDLLAQKDQGDALLESCR